MIGRHSRTQAGCDRRGAAQPSARWRKKRRSRSARSSCSDYVGIRARANDAAGSLPYGDQRRLEIARALATEPKLLALDEPAAGMNPAERVGARQADPPHPRRRRHGASHRARRAPGDERLRPRDGARLRREDRRGHAGRSAEGPESHRGLPGRAACCLKSRASRCTTAASAPSRASTSKSREGELVCLIGANGAGKTTHAQGDLPADRLRRRRHRLLRRRHLPRARCTSCRARAW